MKLIDRKESLKVKSLQFRRRILPPLVPQGKGHSAITKNKIDQGEEAGRSDVDSEVAEINAFDLLKKVSMKNLKRLKKKIAISNLLRKLQL